jgi:triosephosphate isomerase
MKFPVLIINFKTYPLATGKNAEHLAEICDRVAKETGKNIMIAVQATDIYRIKQKVAIPIISQHMDGFDQGRHTGRILAESIKSAGAHGTLLNHSEDQYKLDELENAIKKAHKLNLKTIVCVNNSETAEAAATLEPDVIAVEPPELIAGKISVSEAEPEIVSSAVEMVHRIANIPVICGAGVHNRRDVKAALELGAKGVLVASAVCKSIEPESVIRDFLKGFD